MAVKIVLVNQYFAPEFEGGTELVVRAQAEALARRGHQVRVVCGSELPHRGQDVVRQALGELEVCFLPRLEPEIYDLELHRPRLQALLEPLCAAADLVHVHHWSTLSGSLIRSLSASRPVLVSLHDLFVTCPRFFRVPHPSLASCPTEGWDRASCVRCIQPDAGEFSASDLERMLDARRAGFRAELQAAARVLVPSQAHRDMLARFVELPAHTSVLPHGLCTQPGSLSPLTVPAEFNRDNPLRVLYLGHRTAVKGVEDLVDALAGLPAAQRDALHLILLGSELSPGFDQGLRERSAGLSMEFGVRYEPSSLSSLVQAAGGAHLAALPSQVSESYGLVTDEAMGLGLPVWVSDRGAPRERVGPGGKVLPAQDPGAWRASFGELLAKPELLKEARRVLPISARTADNAAQDLEEIYRQLLSSS